MKIFKLVPLLLLFLVSSCVSVRVTTDYDTGADFKKYKTFAFYKPGIDKADISDLDKRRILRAIESELIAKGLQKSDDPDLLVSIFTKEKERIDIYQGGFGYGYHHYGYYGAYGYGGNYARSTTEGTLFIDFIDSENKRLVWQGKGTASLRNSSVEAKEARTKEFVYEILQRYPPGAIQK